MFWNSRILVWVSVRFFFFLLPPAVKKYVGAVESGSVAARDALILALQYSVNTF